MAGAVHNISETSPRIRQLDDAAINRIAAGEVIERPASAVKELVENALDAGARHVDIFYADGGKTLLRVVDDGHGIRAEDLPLALSRHATSKIDGSDLLNIHSFGFRGEALPSLGAVGRLSIVSRASGDTAAALEVQGGKVGDVRPAALNTGSKVELRDLFHATPARLKFLRSDRAEAQAIGDVVKRLAMAQPYVGFTLRDVSGSGDGRQVLRVDPGSGSLFDALSLRLGKLMGREFAENSIHLDATRDGIRLTGMAGLPTFSRGSSVAQYLFVNGRPVRDKVLIGALRAAYRDVMSRDRHPAAALFIECPTDQVDVNVHPAKSEVRFRDPGLVRGLIVSGLRHALAEAGHRSSSTIGTAMLGAAQVDEGVGRNRVYAMERPSQSSRQASYQSQAPVGEPEGFFEAPAARVDPPETEVSSDDIGALGAARAQVHETYIIAQTDAGIVIVDQHAAHERLVYEKLKSEAEGNQVPAQALLVPDIVELGENATLLLEQADTLRALGLTIEPFGQGAVAVRETPAILGVVDTTGLLNDIVDELVSLDDSEMPLRSRINAILSRMSCHGSIRAGRQMRAEEMNALLREMEATPLSGQCNHGRPTYVSLKLSDIERLFGRS